MAAGNADDIHSFWRPGVVSPKTGTNTRRSVWYTPNLARSAADVYVAPNGAVAGMACLVVEIAGLGPWDTVTGVYGSYAAAAAIAEPRAGRTVRGGVRPRGGGGGNTASGQALAPSGWSPLQTVTASDGSDHACDVILTSACTATTGSVSVNATASSVEDISGVIIGVLREAPSPIPAGGNPAWPYMIYEMAFGSGFATPADEMTWTSLNNFAVPDAPRRFWAFNDSTGVPYALGQLQSGSGVTQIDNFDAALCPWNEASPYFPYAVTGTPVRLRMAIGTLGGVTTNRWYVIQRNASEFPEKRNDMMWDYVPMTTTDVWAAVTGAGPTPYRGEVRQDSPAGGGRWTTSRSSGGVQPSTLRNAAPATAPP